LIKGLFNSEYSERKERGRIHKILKSGIMYDKIISVKKVAIWEAISRNKEIPRIERKGELR